MHIPCRIAISPSIRAIKNWAFNGCLGLTTVTFGNGLEQIGWKVFARYASLIRIAIPPSVTAIHEEALIECSNLMNVRSYNEIKEFVCGESMQDWWDHRVHENCLSTYCFFVDATFWNMWVLCFQGCGSLIFTTC
jgi:hypothetical protein